MEGEKMVGGDETREYGKGAWRASRRGEEKN